MDAKEPPQGIFANIEAVGEGDFIFFVDRGDAVAKVTGLSIANEQGEHPKGNVELRLVDGTETTVDAFDVDYELRNPYLGACLLPESVMAHSEEIAETDRIDSSWTNSDNVSHKHAVEAAHRIEESDFLSPE